MVLSSSDTLEQFLLPYCFVLARRNSAWISGGTQGQQLAPNLGEFTQSRRLLVELTSSPHTAMPPRRRSRTPSSRPPSKRARHSSSASADPGPCSLLDLPIELLSDIVKRLRRKELRLLSQTCKAFYEAYRHQVVMKYAAEDCLAIRLWCLSDAEEGEFGWSPFVIDLVHQKYEHKASRGAPAELIVATFTPEFERFEEDELTSDYMHVELTNGYVEMEGEYWGTQAYLNDVGGATVRYLDWDRDIRGRLVRATPELLYSRFTCPECEGTK